MLEMHQSGISSRFTGWTGVQQLYSIVSLVILILAPPPFKEHLINTFKWIPNHQ